MVVSVGHGLGKENRITLQDFCYGVFFLFSRTSEKYSEDGSSVQGSRFLEFAIAFKPSNFPVQFMDDFPHATLSETVCSSKTVRLRRFCKKIFGEISHQIQFLPVLLRNAIGLHFTKAECW